MILNNYIQGSERDYGLIPRTVVNLFNEYRNEINKNKKIVINKYGNIETSDSTNTGTIHIWLSFYQLYNDHVIDLLKDQKKLIRQNGDTVFIEDLFHLPVANATESIEARKKKNLQLFKFN